MDQTINQFVTESQELTPAERAQVVARLRNFIGRAVRPVANGVKMNDATIQATIAAVEALDAPAATNDQPAPAAQPAPANVAICKVDPRNFARGVKYAKTFGGRFDGQTKTWIIPLEREQVRASLTAAAAYGLIVVEGL